MTSDLAQRPDVARTRARLHQILERVTAAPAGQDTEHAAAALNETIALLEQDPTLALRSETARVMELIGELARQLPPLNRQADQTRAHTRISETAAEDQRAQVREHLRTCCQWLREQTRPDWHTPHQIRALAAEHMPGPDEAAQTLTRAADRLRQSVEAALAIDPDLPQAHRITALADQIDALNTARTCAAPRCGAPLPAAEPGRGRERRYCSPACRRRAKR